MHRFFKICIAVLGVSAGFQLAGAEPPSESDLERIYMLEEGYRHSSGSSFFVFKGYNEQNRPLFEPLSGVRSRYRISVGRLNKTDYFADAEPFEIALDAYKEFYATRKEFKFYQRLLASLGKADLIEPLHKAEQEQQSFRKALNAVITELNEKIKANQLRSRQAAWNRTQAELASRNTKKKNGQGYSMGSSCTASPDELQADTTQDELNDLFEKYKKTLEKNLQNINHIIEQQLQNRNIIVALSIYLNMKKFWEKNTRSFNYSPTGQKMWEEKQKELSGLITQTAPLIIEKIKERYNNLASNEFTTHYPDARGLWSESPPSSPEDLLRFAERFYQVREESLNYSPNTDFEKWGNCRLTLLLCAGGQPESRYLENEFRKELKRAARLNNRQSN